MASGAFASAGFVRQGRGRLILEIDIRERLAEARQAFIVGAQKLDALAAGSAGGFAVCGVIGQQIRRGLVWG